MDFKMGEEFQADRADFFWVAPPHHPCAQTGSGGSGAMVSSDQDIKNKRADFHCTVVVIFQVLNPKLSLNFLLQNQIVSKSDT